MIFTSEFSHDFDKCVIESFCDYYSDLLNVVSLQDMISKVSSLLMTVKSVEDKTSRGARALDSSMDAIKQAVAVSNYVVIRVRLIMLI